MTAAHQRRAAARDALDYFDQHDDTLDQVDPQTLAHLHALLTYARHTASTGCGECGLRNGAHKLQCSERRPSQPVVTATETGGRLRVTGPAR